LVERIASTHDTPNSDRNNQQVRNDEITTPNPNPPTPDEKKTSLKPPIPKSQLSIFEDIEVQTDRETLLRFSLSSSSHNKTVKVKSHEMRAIARAHLHTKQELNKMATELRLHRIMLLQCEVMATVALVLWSQKKQGSGMISFVKKWFEWGVTVRGA
jgi:hypothetical protein